MDSFVAKSERALEKVLDKVEMLMNKGKISHGFFNQKDMQRYIFFLLSLFLMMGSFQSYAQAAGQSNDENTMSPVDIGMYNDRRLIMDLQQGWKNHDALSNKMYGEEPNAAGLAKTTGTGTIESITCILSPKMCLTDEDIRDLAANPNVSDSATLGLLDYTSAHTVGLAYNQPNVSVTRYLAQEWVPGYESTNNSVYAGGYDYLSNSGILPLWRVSMSIAYILFVLVLMVAGFMIMFRQKLGGQTAVTVYNTLPNIIGGLVLVTLSFVIVGTILNVSAYATNLSKEILLSDTASGSNIAMYVVHPFSLATANRKLEEEEDNIAREKVEDVARGILGGAANDTIIGFIGQASEVAGDAVQAMNPLSQIWAILVMLIFAYASVKVYVALLKSFLGILADTVLGPVILAIASIPGQTKMRSAWFNRVLRNAFTFPVVFILINLPVYFKQHNISLDFTGLSTGTLEHGVMNNITSSGVQSIGSWFSSVTALGFSKILGSLMKGLVPLFLYFAAAQVPDMLKTVFPTEQNKALVAVGQGVKQSVSKIPLVGGFFKE